jgi:hypothetical protein
MTYHFYEQNTKKRIDLHYVNLYIETWGFNFLYLFMSGLSCILLVAGTS